MFNAGKFNGQKFNSIVEVTTPTGLTILDFERAIMRGAFRGIMRGVA